MTDREREIEDLLDEIAELDVLLADGPINAYAESRREYLQERLNELL